MSKSFVMPTGAQNATLTATTWGSGRSARLEDGSDYSLPQLTDDILFVSHSDPDWTSILLGNTTELALSSVCKTFVGRDYQTHRCTGTFSDIVRDSAMNGHTLAHLLVRLLSRGNQIHVSHREDFVTTFDNQPVLKSVYQLDIVGTPVPAAQLQSWEASQTAAADSAVAGTPNSAPID